MIIFFPITMSVYITAISPFKGPLYQIEQKQLDFIDILLGYYLDCDIRQSFMLNTNKGKVTIYFDTKSIDEDPMFINERTNILLTFDNQYYSTIDDANHIDIDTFETFEFENDLGKSSSFLKKLSFVNNLLQKIMNDKTIFII